MPVNLASLDVQSAREAIAAGIPQEPRDYVMPGSFFDGMMPGYREGASALLTFNSSSRTVSCVIKFQANKAPSFSDVECVRNKDLKTPGSQGGFNCRTYRGDGTASIYDNGDPTAQTQVNRGGLCVGDPVYQALPTGRVLPDDHVLRGRNYACLSTGDGVVCTNTDTGAGFTISDADIRILPK